MRSEKDDGRTSDALETNGSTEKDMGKDWKKNKFKAGCGGGPLKGTQVPQGTRLKIKFKV